MEWVFSEDRPIFQQLYEQLARRIVTGVYPAGGKMPSVRELAAEAGVNPNTMQRALSQLEAAGLAETSRTAGRTVTSSPERIAGARNAFAREAAQIYLGSVKALGLSRSDAVELLKAGEESENE